MSFSTPNKRTFVRISHPCAISVGYFPSFIRLARSFARMLSFSRHFHWIFRRKKAPDAYLRVHMAILMHPMHRIQNGNGVFDGIAYLWQKHNINKRERTERKKQTNQQMKPTKKYKGKKERNKKKYYAKIAPKKKQHTLSYCLFYLELCYWLRAVKYELYMRSWLKLLVFRVLFFVVVVCCLINFFPFVRSLFFSHFFFRFVRFVLSVLCALVNEYVHTIFMRC